MSPGLSYFENPWAVGVLILACLLFGFEIFLQKSFRWWQIFRFIWLAALSFLIATWMTVTSLEWSQPELVYVLLDRSDSISKIPERKERAEKFLQEFKNWSQAKRQPVRYLSFAESPREERDPLAMLWGGSTTLLQNTADLAFSGSAELPDAASVILLSDGNIQDNVRIRLPTYALQLGSRSEKDVWVENLQPIFTAFLKNRLKIPLTLGQRGFDGASVEVSLWKDDEKLETQTVNLNAPETRAEFTYFPEKMGETLLRFQIEEKSGELSTLNNLRPFRVRTVRDKIRVLHIGGKPSLDLKAWRLFLTRQPDVDLVSFYILRSLADEPEAKQSELSLIPFPYEELFSTELVNFDVVILHNFDFSLYFRESELMYLSNLSDFVKRGGGLLMIGGDQSFHQYRNTPLKPLFPFIFLNDGRFENETSLVFPHTSHPIIEGLEDVFRGPIWTGHHRILHHPQATDLLVYQPNIPFLSIRQVDEGRIIALNSDETWKLQLQPLKQSAVLGRLARRMLQYLTFDPEIEPLQIQTSKWQVGKRVNLKMSEKEARDWFIQCENDRRLTWEFKAKTSVDFLVEKACVYRVRVSGLPREFFFETEEKPWMEEWKHLVRSNERLHRLTQANSGKVVEYEDKDQLFNQNLTGQQVVSSSSQAWNQNQSLLSWIVFLAAIFCLILDFYFRKKEQWDH